MALADAIDWLIEQHLFQLEQKPGAGRLLEIMMTLLGDGLLPDGFRVRRVNSDGLWIARDGIEFPLREMSDGYRAVTALVVDIVRRTAAYQMATSEYAMLTRHPWLVQAFGSYQLYGPGKARHDDHSLAVYEAAGFAGSEADQATSAVFTFVLGNALGLAATALVHQEARARRR